MILNPFNYPDGNQLDRFKRLDLMKSSQYMKIIELKHRLMGLNVTCCDDKSQVQSKQKDIHVRDTIIAGGSL